VAIIANDIKKRKGRSATQNGETGFLGKTEGFSTQAAYDFESRLL